MAMRRCSSKLPRNEWIECMAAGAWPSSRPGPAKGIAYHRSVGGYHVFYMRAHDDPNYWVYHIGLDDESAAGALIQIDEWSEERFDSVDDVKLALLKRVAELLGKS